MNRMKSMYAGVVIALSSLFIGGVASTAAAQDTAAGGYKIAVVDVQMVLRDYKKRQAKYAELEAKVKSLQGEVDALSNKVKAGKENYDKRKSENAPTEELMRLESAVRQDATAYQLKLQEHQALIDNMERTVLEEVIGDVELAINEIGKSQNYHLILNAKEGSAGSVVYFSDTLDVTQAVLGRLNGGVAPAAAPAPAAEEEGRGRRRDN